MADGNGLMTSSAQGVTVDSEAERALLSAGLCGGRSVVVEAIEAGVRAVDFCDPRRQATWGVMAKLAEDDCHVDTLTVVDGLMHAGKLDAVGGSQAIAQLEALMHSTRAASTYARLVRDGAAYRRISEAAQLLNQGAQLRDSTAAELAAEAQDVFMHINERSMGHAEIVDRKRVVREVLDGSGKRAPGCIPTGLKAIDSLFRGGLRKGNLHLVAGRPGMAKTAFALAVAANVADGDVPVGFLSLEVPAEDLIEREIASASRCAPMTWGRRDEAAKAAEAAARVEARELHVIDRAGLTISEVCAVGRRMKARQGIGLFIVDHIGKIRASDRYAGDRNNEVGEISEALRTLANHLDIPVLAVSQLNRKVEERKDKRPLLSDLRDSGSLEQDAYSVLLLYRAEYYLKEATPDGERNLCEVEVAKNRGGPTGTVALSFDAPTSRFWSRAA